MKIGVLALQGAFLEHEQKLHLLGIDHFQIRKKADFQQPMNGLIIPGGESTTIGKLFRDLDMLNELKMKIEQGLPVFGTCAGMILLAKQIGNDHQVHLGVMDITVKRNAYGRQLGSFHTENEFKGIGIVPMTFIRAPYIEIVGNGVEVLSTVDNRIVAAKEKNMLVTAYHPELTSDTRVHRYFIDEFVK